MKDKFKNRKWKIFLFILFSVYFLTIAMYQPNPKLEDLRLRTEKKAYLTMKPLKVYLGKPLKNSHNREEPI
jgi:hypothetical protein